MRGVEVDDRTLRAAIIVIGHFMWLSTAALRLLRGDRAHRVQQRSHWLVELYPVGASLALESLALLAITALLIVPYTAMRVGAEERVLRAAFGSEYDAYAS